MTQLSSPEVQELEIRVEEATRATAAGEKRFVEPAEGTLRRAISKRHHIVFGRRGSGKSSLLRKAAVDLAVDRRPTAYVDMETFKGHAYPDVLLSVLIESFERFKEWLETVAVHPSNKTSWWRKLFGRGPTRKPVDRAGANALAQRLDLQIKELKALLHGADDAATEMTRTRSQESGQSGTVGLELKGKGLKLSGSEADSEKTIAEEQTKVAFRQSKTDFLHRHILEYRLLFRELAALVDGDSYLFLDDLYYIRRADQASVLDYFHRIAKGNGLWLKAGTIRHRTRWYTHGDPSIGLKIGDDADEIDLDLTLEKFSITRGFLIDILKNFISEAPSLAVDALLTDGAIDRLVLASGGVARDFLNIFRRSIRVARERSGRGQQADRIGVEDINNAAGEYESVKREELRSDAPEDQEALEEEFRNVGDFCKKHGRSNVFLLKQDDTSLRAKRVQELVDLRLIHKIRQRVTVSHRKREIFEGYMLDVSQYTASRKIRDFEIMEFWRPENTDKLRRESLIYGDDEPRAATPE
ncbi:hypothetical protein [Cystobacter ferrugineus]|nr:hypothetical protein [Cystobacter ferrugineus]